MSLLLTELLKKVKPYFNVFTHVSMCASVLMIVAFTFERHFAIRSPHQYRIHIRTTEPWKHLSFYIVPVTILSFFFNVPIFINLQVSPQLIMPKKGPAPASETGGSSRFLFLQGARQAIAEWLFGNPAYDTWGYWKSQIYVSSWSTVCAA